MKNLILKQGSLISKLLCAMGLLSVSACDRINPGGDMRLMYGCPSADYKYIGKVQDEAGNPIQGIKISNLDSQNSSLSNKTGEFSLQTKNEFGIPLIILEDIDGEANGGVFKSDTLRFESEDFKQVKKGDGWYRGVFELKESANVVLKKEEENK